MRYTRVTGLLLGIALGFATTQAFADNDRRGGYHHGGHHSEHRYHGKQYKPNRGWHRHHRASRQGSRHGHRRPSWVVERHVIVHEPPRPRVPRRVDHHHYHSHSVPLVSVGGVPIIVIRNDR